jgi:hypothetical protein
MSKKAKTVQLLTPPCEHGKAMAAIIDEDGGATTTEINLRKKDDVRPIQPGETMLTLEGDEKRPGRYNVTGEYTHPGPSRVATPKYRDNYEAIFGKRTPSSNPKELN